MKKLLLISMGVGLGVFGGLLWWQPGTQAPTLAAEIAPAQVARPLESAFPTATGLVGTGGTTPLLAHTAGQVEDVFFASGDYARRGQLLVKLTNHNFVIAPRAGFLGPSQVKMGQYITKATPVTTLARYSYLVVPVQLPAGWQNNVQAGDSVQVWAKSRPDRVVRGVMGPMAQSTPVEILLTSRAPFRIGEQANVRLCDKRRVAVAR